MSCSVHQVSKEQTVVSFYQNQKEPNKVGAAMVEAMQDLVIAGAPYTEAYNTLKAMHNDFRAKNTRGIDSIQLSCQTPLPDHSGNEQRHKSIYLSYKLNGTFATYTEYYPYKKGDNND